MSGKGKPKKTDYQVKGYQKTLGIQEGNHHLLKKKRRLGVSVTSLEAGTAKKYLGRGEETKGAGEQEGKCPARKRQKRKVLSHSTKERDRREVASKHPGHLKESLI